MKRKDNKIAIRIRDAVGTVEPKAQVILFGSRARGEARNESDWDLLILTNYPDSYKIEDSFRDILYDLELETGELFSIFVYNKKDWNTKHKVTPLYQNIKKDGIRL